MKKVIIDGYEVYCENGEFKKVKFKNYLGEEICIDIEESLKIELLKRRKEEYSEDYKKRRYINRFLHDNCLIEIKKANITENPEKIMMDKYKKERIIREIWNLPSPQNRRVYMRIVDGFSLVKIARIENKNKSAIKRSVDAGLQKLKKILKNF